LRIGIYLLEVLVAGEEAEFIKSLQKLRQFRMGPVQIEIMSESVKLRNSIDSRLIRVGFPGMYVQQWAKRKGQKDHFAFVKYAPL
jgi:hypothetical protein